MGYHKPSYVQSRSLGFVMAEYLCKFLGDELGVMK